MNDDDMNSLNDSSQGYADSNSVSFCVKNVYNKRLIFYFFSKKADDTSQNLISVTGNHGELLALVIKDKEIGSSGHHEGFSVSVAFYILHG